MTAQQLMSPLPKSSEISPSRLRARAEGAMLAAACGDALGWPVEPRGNRVGGTRDLKPKLAFVDWTRREGGGYAPHQRDVPAGTYSDDTQLMLAVARSIGLGNNWWQHFSGLELPLWTLYELGGGGAIKRAARSWSKSVPPWAQDRPADRLKYFNAGANGVVMRILPHAIHGAHDESFEAIGQRIVADGITTHGHPRALIGALAAGYAMWTAVRWQGKVGYGELIEHCLGEHQRWSVLPDLTDFAADWAERRDKTLDSDYTQVWDHTVEEMLGLLSTCRDAMERGSLARDSHVLAELGAFEREGGSGTRTAAVAIYLASRYVARPSAGLLSAAFARRTDADTIACVTGALLGALTGDEWIEGLAGDLQDCSYIRSLGRVVAEHEPADVATTEWHSRLKRTLLDRLRSLGIGDSMAMPVFKAAVVDRVEHPETRSANDITTWWVTTEVGQRLAITKISRRQAPPDGHRVTPDEAARSRGLQPDTSEALAHSHPEVDSAQSFWLTVLVEDLPRSTILYRDLLGLWQGRKGPDFVSFRPNLVLQQVPHGSRGLQRHVLPSARPFDAEPFVNVLLSADALERAHRRVAEAGYTISDIVRDPGGARFRLLDPDGHIVEVRASARG